MSWKPMVRPDVDLRSIDINPTSAFVLSRLDGATTLSQLQSITGLSGEKIDEILAQLCALGAIDAPPEVDENQVDAGPATHRKYFETQLRDLPVDQRQARALKAIDPELSALCFDSIALVIASIFQNPRSGLQHARLVARHHATTSGLEVVIRNTSFSADEGVRRALLANSMLTRSMYQRLWGSKRLLSQYAIAISREVPESTKRVAKEVLRSRFSSTSAEERVELIVKTEGRCLKHLSGLSLDGRTLSLLCAHHFASSLLVQNIARWPTAPPALLAHLLRVESVRRSPMLKTLLQRHPNAP